MTFATDGEYLTAPDLYALGRTFSITLNMVETGAEGFIIYKSTDGEVFEYLATTTDTQYVDEDVTEGETYYYRAYAYREEEISPVSETVSQKADTCSPYTESAKANSNIITVTVHAQDNYDSVRLYRSTDGTHFGTHIQEIENVGYGETLKFVDSVPTNGTYYYVAFATNGGYEYFSNWIVSTEVTSVIAAPEITALVQNGSSVNVTILANDNYDYINLYHSVDGITYSRVRTITFTKPGETNTVVIDAVEVGTNYFYAVPSVSGYEFSAEKIYTVDVIDLTPPSISKVESTCNSAKLTFASSLEYDSYTVYSVTVKYGFSFYTELATVVTPEYTVENLNIGEEYLFAVSGDFGGIKSDKSANATAIPSHSVKNMPMLDATCTTDGYTAYTYCEYCGTVLSGKDEILATGHSYEETEAEIPATTTSVGKTAVYTCSGCGDSYGGEEIPKLEDAFTLAGDANGDGEVNLIDILRTLKAVVGAEVKINRANADMDGDNEITVKDVLAAMMLILDK